MWEFLPLHSYRIVILSGGKKDYPSRTQFAEKAQQWRVSPALG